LLPRFAGFLIFDLQLFALSYFVVTVKEYTDSEIIECLRKRESYVVQYLWDRYIPMVRLIVTRMGGTTEDAKDIFQESLVIMLEKIDSREFALTCRFKTYLYCVCGNLWKSVLDKRKAASNYFLRKTDDGNEKDIGELMDKKISEEIFREVFESLDPVSKNILKLYWQDVSPQEIAGRLGYTYGYVRKKKCEAQADLTKRVKNHPGFRQIMDSEEVAKKVVY
jgi:RNA polymerase sigma factor (sigma-70 family)